MAEILYIASNSAAKRQKATDYRTVIRRYHPDATLVKLDKMGRQFRVPLYRVDDSGDLLSARKLKKNNYDA